MFGDPEVDSRGVCVESGVVKGGGLDDFGGRDAEHCLKGLVCADELIGGG